LRQPSASARSATATESSWRTCYRVPTMPSSPPGRRCCCWPEPPLLRRFRGRWPERCDPAQRGRRHAATRWLCAAGVAARRARARTVLTGVTLTFAPAGAALSSVLPRRASSRRASRRLAARRIAVWPARRVRIGEVLLRVVAGMVAVAAALGRPEPSVVSSPVRAARVAGLAARLGPRQRGWTDLRWRSHTLAESWRWRETGALTAVQVMLGGLTACDVVLAPALAGAGSDAGGFQLAGTLGRAPLFVATALAVVLFPRLGRPGATAAVGSAVAGFAGSGCRW